MHHVRLKEPEDLVHSLILSSQTVTKYVCTDLQLEFDAETPTEIFVPRLLWKAGFNPPQFGDFEERFQKRLREFNDVLLSSTPILTEDQRELIRRAGVNLFVSVEEVLETVLVYNVWLLSRDHFVDTRFKFNLSAARPTVASVLGPELDTEQAKMVWDVDGGNTLGVSMAYLDATVRWMRGLESAARDSLLRPDAELPFYANDRRFVFPFRHKSLWADADPSALRRYVDDFAKVVRLLAQSNLAFVRNGLDHRRDNTAFPGGDAMFACVARIREAFEIVDATRLYPKVFWVYETIAHQAGTNEVKVKDYAGRVSTFYGPPLAMGINRVKFGEPFHICPGSLLSAPNSEITFWPVTWNVYSKYWEGYPRRRVIPLADRRGSLEDLSPTGPRTKKDTDMTAELTSTNGSSASISEPV
jgi:hypothetical protein